MKKTDDDWEKCAKIKHKASTYLKGTLVYEKNGKTVLAQYFYDSWDGLLLKNLYYKIKGTELPTLLI